MPTDRFDGGPLGSDSTIATISSVLLDPIERRP
jgi:hypothetical protein